MQTQPFVRAAKKLRKEHQASGKEPGAAASSDTRLGTFPARKTLQVHPTTPLTSNRACAHPPQDLRSW